MPCVSLAFFLIGPSSKLTSRSSAELFAVFGLRGFFKGLARAVKDAKLRHKFGEAASEVLGAVEIFEKLAGATEDAERCRKPFQSLNDQHEGGLLVPAVSITKKYPNIRAVTPPLITPNPYVSFHGTFTALKYARAVQKIHPWSPAFVALWNVHRPLPPADLHHRCCNSGHFPWYNVRSPHRFKTGEHCVLSQVAGVATPRPGL